MGTVFITGIGAHAVLRRRPNNCTLVEGAPTKAPLSGITILRVSPRVMDHTLGQTNRDEITPSARIFTYLRNDWKSSNTASHPGHLQTPWL